MGKARIVILAGDTALILAGCMRQSPLYEINDNGTWLGNQITLDNEPMSSFADPASGFVIAVFAVRECFEAGEGKLEED